MRKNPHVRIRGGLGSVTALVYPTAEQAARGRQSYRQECEACHLERLRGDG